jgi:IclR family transcriptional regulator, pca regulon regulatory protein
MAARVLSAEARNAALGMHIDPGRPPDRYSSSLIVGLAMLRCFTAEHPVRGIAEMSDELGLGRSTTCRYALTLVELGYLDQSPSRKYRLSASSANVGLYLLNSAAVRRAARERLRRLRDRTGRTVSLGVLAGGEVFYLDHWRGWRQGQHGADVALGPGTHRPAHCAAAGKVLLAWLPEAERLEAMAHLGLRRLTPKTLTRKAALRVELERIAGGAAAVEDEEGLVGRRALAAAVPGGEGQPIAAVEIAVPAAAYTLGELVERFGPLVANAAEEIRVALR